ncbi:MAG: rhomboid family intramembrane serine protease [Candidatus Pacebacteria bacterium]|nr:rhomboid family intramembrane serine protease [Candidatus Paceibacterota bacterium]
MFPLYDESRKKGRWPFFTILLILVNIAIFFYTYPNLKFYIDFYGFVAEDFLNGKFYTVITSMFIHGDIFHLLGNMWFLWVFGDNLENKLGHFKFLLFYFLCGLSAIVLYTATSIGSNVAIVGASGAISGILGGYLVLFPKNKIKAVIPFPVYFVYSPPAFLFVIVWFAIQLLSVGGDSIVAYWAHIGGFLAGILFIKKIKKLF